MTLESSIRGIAFYLVFQISLLLGIINCVKNIIDKNNKMIEKLFYFWFIMVNHVYLVYLFLVYYLWLIYLNLVHLF